jgi:hypothetical protein
MTSLVNYLASSGYRISAVLCGCAAAPWVIEMVLA